MEINLMGEIRIMKDLGIKPNYSELARKYGVDRHTVRKYYEAGEIPPRKPSGRASAWEPLRDEIERIMDKPDVTKASAYYFLQEKYGDDLPGSYSGFRAYTLKNGIDRKGSISPHPLYETAPGEQLQVDWKEDLKITLKDGEVLEFNVFSATLSYSRMHVFVYSPGKTMQDFMRCMAAVLRRLGGIPRTVLTDNMSAVVSVQGRCKKRHAAIDQFFKDLGIELKLCKARTPQTKGKDENSNKFVNRLGAYDGELASEEELIRTIEVTIAGQANAQVNTGTRMPPLALFAKEKEYLGPLPSAAASGGYAPRQGRAKVPETLLVPYGGSRYSVPPKFVGKVVDIYPIGDHLHICHKGILIATHIISHKAVCYSPDHYALALGMSIGREADDIEEFAKANLERLDRLGSKNY